MAQHLNFWIDKWMRECSSRELIEGTINKMKSNMTVANMLQGNEWNWNALSFKLPIDILDKIKATPIQMYRDKKDTLSWSLSKDGEFSSALAYLLAIPNRNQDIPFLGEWIWKLDTLPRIQSFLWHCHHNIAPVREVIASRGIVCDTICPFYRSYKESILHLLRDCPYAMKPGERLESQCLSKHLLGLICGSG